ncbi:hypothetical protein LCGC14_1648150, partial [marine sediment metagenome]
VNGSALFSPLRSIGAKLRELAHRTLAAPETQESQSSVPEVRSCADARDGWAGKRENSESDDLVSKLWDG